MLNKYLSQCVCLELFLLPLTAHHVFHICIFLWSMFKRFIMYSVLLIKLCIGGEQQ